MKRRTLILSALAAAVAVFAVVDILTSPRRDTGPEGRRWFRDEFELTLPESATVQERWTTPYWSLDLDWHSLAMAVMPRSELDAFMKSLPPKAKLSDTARSVHDVGLPTAAPRWWKPDSAFDFLSGQWIMPHPGNTHLLLLLDLDDPNAVVIYACALNT